MLDSELIFSSRLSDRDIPLDNYKIIYLDPPWSYRDKALAGSRGAGCKYELMTMESLRELPIFCLADNDCAMFMWITMPIMEEFFMKEIFKSWGFKYKTVAFTWVKRNKKQPSWFWGMGNFTRANSELCLLATRGKPKRISASVHSVIDTSIERHSKKPDIVRDRIVELFGDVPRIELFARERCDGWDSWGLNL